MVRCTFSPARAWRPAVVARLARTLGVTEHMSLPTTTVKYQDLESALDWSSSGGPYENTALLSRRTGDVFLKSMHGDFGEELPEDIEDGTLYVSVPHKNELNLGRELVFDFLESVAPQHQCAVESYFRNRGAYAKFKTLLERESILDEWYSFESEATRSALLKWASENGFHVTDIPSAA